MTEVRPREPTRPLWRRLLWFAGLWLAGVVAVVSFSYLMRWWLL